MTGFVLSTGIVGYTGTTVVVLPPLVGCSIYMYMYTRYMYNVHVCTCVHVLGRK